MHLYIHIDRAQNTCADRSTDDTRIGMYHIYLGGKPRNYAVHSEHSQYPYFTYGLCKRSMMIATSLISHFFWEFITQARSLVVQRRLSTFKRLILLTD